MAGSARSIAIDTRGSGGAGEEPCAEFVPALGRELEAGRAGVATVADEQVAAALQGRPQVERAVAPARGSDDVAEVGSHHGRATAVLDEASRDQPDDPDAPRSAHDRG